MGGNVKEKKSEIDERRMRVFFFIREKFNGNYFPNKKNENPNSKFFSLFLKSLEMKVHVFF